MTRKRDWSKIFIDDVKANVSFDISNDEGLRDAFNWESMSPLLKIVYLRTGGKYNFLEYRLHFIKAINSSE